MEENILSKFERNLIGIIAILTSLSVLYISLIGPLFFNELVYKTSTSGNYQFIGQDIINLILIFPLLLIGGTLLIMNRNNGIYLLAFVPFYLLYYALSYAIGIEWSNSRYIGNSQQYVFYFIEIVVSSVLILLYSINIVKNKRIYIRRSSLLIYSTLAVLFTLMFSLMDIKDICANLISPTLAYNEAPTLYWFIKMFDLGLTIPLMFASIYLLWTRPGSSYILQLFIYGFFITILTAVNSMGFVMYMNDDPSYSFAQQIIFIALDIISIYGLTFVTKNTKLT